MIRIFCLLLVLSFPPAGKAQHFGLSFQGLRMPAASGHAPAISFRETLYPFPPAPLNLPQAFYEAGRLKTEFDRWTMVFSAQSDLQIDWNLLLFEKYNARCLDGFLWFDLPVEEQLKRLKKRLKEKE
jgi:hypothetical protein